jgi:hypothetical protein
MQLNQRQGLASIFYSLLPFLFVSRDREVARVTVGAIDQQGRFGAKGSNQVTF